MATEQPITKILKGMPKEDAEALAKQLAGLDVGSIGKARVFPRGIPFPDQWVLSVLPTNSANARKLIDVLVTKPGHSSFEVFPYGIVNPEIGRIDIRAGH